MNHFFTYFKKTLWQGTLQFLVSIVLLLMFSTSLFAGNYTWNGTTNNQWGTASNWSGGVVPSSNDTVTIGSGSDTILIAANTTIYRLTISGRTINIGGYELEVTIAATLSGGKIYNGTLKLRGTYVTFEGTHTDCTIDCITARLELSGGVFDGEGSFEHNGTSNGFGDGGCVFNAPVVITKSTIGILRLGQALPDTFNSRVDFINTYKQPLEISYGSASVFHDLVSLSCRGISSSMTLGNATHSVQFLDDAALVTGEVGLNYGIITLKGIYQSGQVGNELIGDDGLVINMDSCTFTGDVTLTAPSILLKNSVFMGDAAFTKIRTSSNSYCYGGNAFYGSVTLDNQDNSNAFRFANITGDYFYNDVQFVPESNEIQMAHTGTTRFEGDVSINSSEISFKTNNGKVILSGENNQNLDGTGPYQFCKLEISKTSGSVQLNQQAFIDSTITFESGILYTDSLLTLKATATTTGASNLSFVDGTVKKIGNTAFVFPVGDQGQYYPAGISPPGTASDAFQCQYIGQHSNLSENSDSTITSLSQCQYWKIERISGSAAVSVTLYWDSLGCGVLDTAGLIIANWNGSIWKDLGRSSSTGNAFIGSITNLRTVAEFSYFTLASVAAMVTLTPTLDNSKTRTMPEDFFGYNGNNTIKSDADGVNLQSWEMIRDHDGNSANQKKYLLDKYITLMRIPAGTFSNYSDWRTGYPIYENDLPNGWKYRQNAYRLPMNRTGNEFQFISDNLSRIGARPIIAFNLLSSRFYYELASLYRMNEVNLPVKYIELGNEFYLSNDQYFEVFPNVDSYMDKAIEWAEDIKQIAAFENTKVAIVGATASEGNSGRQRLWLDQVLNRLKGVSSVDAITLHNYIRVNTNGNSCVGSLANADLEFFLLTAFDNAYELQHDELLKIRIHNIRDSFDKEVWFTEYNLDDDLDIRTGTWAHGLLNTIMTLKYIESRDVTKVISHTMLSGAKYGNIFENDDAFRFIKCHGFPFILNPNLAGSIPTLPIEKSALGTALDAVAYITRGSVSATPILFNGANKLGWSDYDELYGWKFEDAYGNDNSIIVNTGTTGYYLNLSNIYSSVNASLFNAKRISAYSNSNVITQDAVNTIPQPNSTQNLYFTDNPWKLIGPVHLLFIPSYSIVVLKPLTTNATVTARLSDDEICEGTNAILTIESTSSFTPTATNATLTQIEQINDRYIYSVSPTTTGTITITPCSSCSTLQLEVYPNISAFTISGPASYCPGSASIALEASFLAGTGGSNSLDYSYLWAPDSGLVSESGSCSILPKCNKIWVKPERTTIYTAYVTDGHCWASQSVTVTVPVNEFDLGSDIQFCSGTTTPITLESTYKDPNTATVPSYQWSAGTPSPSGTSTTLSPTNITVTLTITEGSCSISDVIDIKMINCCSGATGDAVAEPSIHNFSNSISNAYYITTEAFAAACSTAGYSIKYFDKDGNLITNPLSLIRASVEIDGALVPSKIIYVNGELRIQDDYFDNPSNTNPDIDGLGLILKNCNIKFAENAGINIEYGQLKMENCTLQACSTFMWKGIYTLGLGPKDHLPVEITNCNIKDAVQAFDLKNDVPFSFTGNIFENNNSDVLLTNYFGAIPTDVFINNEFKASGLLSPYSGQQKFAAIQLVNVKNITIGKDVSGSENEFRNSLYGLKSENSSFTLLNNIFSQNGDITNSTEPGACVFATSDFDFSDREIKIGNGFNTGGQNIFKNSTNGVMIKGESSVAIKGNTFGDASVFNDRLTDICISIIEAGSKEILIQNQNYFYDYTHAIDIGDISGRIYLNNNKFWNSVFPSGATAFEGIAININNPINATLLNSEISDNRIGTSNGTNQPRMGIRLSNVNKLRVINNDIYFKHSTVPTDPHKGILAEGCEELKIFDHLLIKNTVSFSSGTPERLIGIDLNQSPHSCIENNTLTNFGYGMQVTGNSVINSLYDNEFNQFEKGIHFNLGDIGAKVGTQSASNPINGNVMGNNWICSGCITNQRITGNYSGAGLIWFTPTNITTDPDFPNNSVIPINTILPFHLAGATTYYSECPIPSDPFEEDPDVPINLRTRNDNFGGVVADTNRYPEDIHNEIRYANRLMVYKLLKKYPALLNFDDSSDSSFASFYNSNVESNLNKIDSVETLLSSRAFVAANSLLANFTDTNTIEYNFKRVYQLYIKWTLQGDTSLTDVEADELYAIAYQHPLTGGKAVFTARNILRLEVDDKLQGNYRIMKGKQYSNTQLKIYPNPANNIVYIQIKENVKIELVQIIDISGRILLEQQNVNEISVLKLIPGIYLIQVRHEGEMFNEKLIINK